MIKWLVLIFCFYLVIGVLIWQYYSYTPISKQIDLKTMSLKNPNYITSEYSTCSGDCRNYSSSSSSGRSSWGGGSSGGK
ncbi:hypothetical protein HG430_002025 [Candidatus Gracilibacteria bacterium]|nr:hypothetical protein [Candidatus Gracilibacteria bacterium]